MFKTVLRIGSTGEDVRRLQTILNKDGHGLVIDGGFGRVTQNAVKTFQKQNKLAPDGVVGINTMQAIARLANRKYSIKWYNKYIQVISFPKNSNVVMDVIDSRTRLESIESMFRGLEKKPTLMFNGSLFDMSNGRSLARFIDEGQSKGANLFSPWGLRYDEKTGLTITYEMRGAKEFIGFSPSLIINDVVQTERNNLDLAFINNLHPRTAFGESVDAFHIIMAHGRRSALGHRGMSIPELKTFCKDVLHCYNAGNFDGGGSSIVINESGVPINKFLEKRKLDNAVAIYL